MMPSCAIAVRDDLEISLKVQDSRISRFNPAG